MEGRGNKRGGKGIKRKGSRHFRGRGGDGRGGEGRDYKRGGKGIKKKGRGYFRGRGVEGTGGKWI